MQQRKISQIGLASIFLAISMACPPASLFGAPLDNPRIGIFTPGLSLTAVHEGMQEGLTRLGYVVDKNITFIVEDTKGSTSDLAARAAKLLSAKPDLLFTVSTDHAQAAKQATSTVPIVFAWTGDPVKAALIPSYPYSKSNLTGVTASGDTLTGKRLEILLELVPKTKHLLVMVAAKETVSVSAFQSLEPAAQKFGVQLIRRDVTDKEQIVKALEEMPRGMFDAIFHVPSTLVRTNFDLLVKRARKDKIPLAVHDDALLSQGVLISYGPNPRAVGRQAADLVDKVLKGTKPGEIVVKGPETFFFAINQATAREIGLKISAEILQRADQLVE
jgi:putative ABC transport system substrate-binding protein